MITLEGIRGKHLRHHFVIRTEDLNEVVVPREEALVGQTLFFVPTLSANMTRCEERICQVLQVPEKAFQTVFRNGFGRGAVGSGL